MESLITDEFWRQFEPLIPKHPKSPKGGRPRKDDRACLEGIAYILRGGVAWHLFPRAEFSVSKSTCFDRFSNGPRRVCSPKAIRIFSTNWDWLERSTCRRRWLTPPPCGPFLGGRTPGQAP